MFGIRIMVVRVAMTESAQLGRDSFGITLAVECGCISLL